METIIIEAIRFLSLLILPAITGAIGYYWGRRKVKEKELFLLWRNAFDRASFRGPFQYHSSKEDFRRAIRSVLKSISFGKIYDTEGRILASIEGVYFGPSQIKDKESQKTIQEVRASLQRILSLSFDVPNEIEKKNIDGERDRVIEKMNKVWDKYGIITMKLPTDYNAMTENQNLFREMDFEREEKI